MLKINREKIYQKFNGHCAYCGESITIRQMQVDHIWPIRLAHWEKNIDPNREENLNPSCIKCNRFKGGYTIDEHLGLGSSFRRELQKQVERLKKNTQFERALKFGQIMITEKPIKFYFEDHKCKP